MLSSSLIPATFSAHYSSLLPEHHKCIKLSYCLKAFCRVQIFSHTALNSESGAELPCAETKETNNGFSTLPNNKGLLNLHPLQVCWVERSASNSGDLKANIIIAVRYWSLIWIISVLLIFKADKKARRYTTYSLFNLLHLLLFITLCIESGQFVFDSFGQAIGQARRHFPVQLPVLMTS